MEKTNTIDRGGRPFIGRGSREQELAARKIVSVCEHFSFEPLISCNCLDISRTGQRLAGLERHFAACARTELIDQDLADESFDLIICDNSYQYFENLALLADRMYSLLKHSGFCYFAGRSGLLPGGRRKGDGDAVYRPLASVKKNLSNFWIHDYTPLILENPAVFDRDPDSVIGMSGLLPLAVRKRIYPHLSEFVWVLTKKK